MFSLPVLTTLFSLAAIVAATPADVGRLLGIDSKSTGRKCGSHPTLEEVGKKEKAFTSLLAENKASGRVHLALSTFDIPVIFHVITGSDGEGDVSDSKIQGQIDVLNQDYTETGVTFTLQDITRTSNADWFNSAGPDTTQQTEMKETLRTGDAATLNVYSVGFTSGDSAGLLGYATFPADYESNPKDDGVVLLYSTLPGNIIGPFNLGRTLTHEVGHWVGLYHTFQGGCSGEGDSVSDTPAEASPSFGCPTSPPDTCSSEGVDPIHNYMDYSDDACMDNFTPGQTERLKSQLSTYRI